MVLVWFILSAIVIVIIQYYLFKNFALRSIEYSRKFSKASCFEGDELEMIEELSNRKALLLPWLYIESQLDAPLKFGTLDNLAVSSGQLYQNHHSFFTLRGHTKVTRKHKLTPMQRGIYKLQTVSVTSGDLLGIVKKARTIPLEGTLTVYPKPLSIPLSNIPYHSWQGDAIVKRFIIHDPFVVAGARPYSAGDSFQHINWKATARTGSLQVHQYDFTANRKLMVVLNIDDREGMWRDVSNVRLIEDGIRYAAGITQSVIREGMEAGFAANMRTTNDAQSVFIVPSSGEAHWYGILEVMASLKLERSETFVQLLEQMVYANVSQTDLLILSSYWNEELEHYANQIRRQNNAVLTLELKESHQAELKNTVLQEVRV